MTLRTAFVLSGAASLSAAGWVGSRSSCTLRQSCFVGASICSRATNVFSGSTRPRVARHGTKMLTDVETKIEGVWLNKKRNKFRAYFKAGVETVSPWHDIPLYPSADRQIVNFVNEIPKNTLAKFEIATDEEMNPIRQDEKDGELRFYAYGRSLVNYGALPQTWEDPRDIDPVLKVGGDGDPIDVTEIGEMAMPFGLVYPVKILGALALLDEGEIDWKIIAINTADPKAKEINDVEDLERVMPGKIAAVREWFKMYKTAEGKGENEYGFNAEAQDAAFAMQVVANVNMSYEKLKSGVISNDDDLWLNKEIEDES